MALKFEKLTPAEMFWLYRKRNYKNQTLMAAHLGIRYAEIVDYELGRLPIPDKLWELIITSDMVLSVPEKLQLLRRRSGLELRQIGEELGLTHTWVGMMERGQVDNKKLIEYWEKKNDA